MKNFGGSAFFIHRNDINTDEIIPAKYLTEITKQALKPHLLEDLHLANELFDPNCKELQEATVLVTGSKCVQRIVSTTAARIIRRRLLVNPVDEEVSLVLGWI